MKPNPEPRPILKPSLQKTDYILEFASFACFIALCMLAILSYRNLPDTIPTHFGFDGKADDWGSKSTVFILPAIVFVLLTGMTILNKYPHIFNYPVTVTQENALSVYTKATRTIRVIKIIIALIFLLIEWNICDSTNNAQLPGWYLPVFIIVPVFLPIVMAFTLTKSSNQGKLK